MKKLIIIFMIIALNTPIITSAEEQLVISNPVTVENINKMVDAQLDVDFFNKTPNYSSEITFGLLTELMHLLPMDDDYADSSEFSLYSLFSEYEIYLLQHIVEAETPGCSFEAHRNVANVIFNRMRTGWGSLVEVLTQPNQFAVYTNDSYKYVDVSIETILAIEAAWEQDYTGGAIYFNKYTTDSYASHYCTFLFRDDAGHDFYK